MKIIIRISTRLRQSAPIPRDFLPIAGLEHLGLVYQQKIITTPEEFNETLARVSHIRFPSRGCAFFPYALTTEDETKMVTGHVRVEVPDDEDLDESVAETSSDIADESLNAMGKDSSKFLLDGKGIFMEGERIAGLFGDDKQLRVLAAYTDLREDIESWLVSQSNN